MAKAMGAEVTVLSPSDRKREAAAALGADHYAVTGGTHHVAGSPQARSRRRGPSVRNPRGAEVRHQWGKALRPFRRVVRS
ncbi:hypothetical protein ABT151_18140 [Streptomyces bluensis]